jgi:hypothetical protein
MADIQRWLPAQHRAPASKIDAYRGRRGREIAALERQYFAADDRRRAVRRIHRVVVAQELARTFNELAGRWSRETAHLSSPSQAAQNANYLRIIGLGRRAVPLILRRLGQQPDFWFVALRSITGQNPVRQEDAGNTNKMRDAWLQWGVERGLL